MANRVMPEGKRITKETASAYGKKGAAVTNRIKKQKKTFKETLDIILNIPIEDGIKYEPEDIKTMAKLEGKKRGKPLNIDNQTAIAISMVKKAQDGDVRAAEGVRDMKGEKPRNEIGIEGQLPVSIVNDLKDEDKKNEGQS